MSTKLKSPSKAVPVAESTAPAASSSKSQASSGSSSSSSKTTTKVVTQVVKEPVVIEVPTGYQVAEAPQIAARDIASPDIEKIDKVDITERKAQLAEQTKALKDQAVANIDRATETGVTALKEAEEEALPQYQVMRDRVDIDEAKALDNQVLYSEARGDKGGIGKSQYASIQNTAAQNRLAVNAAQVQMTNDTAKQIANLRSQGEYEKADKLLSISQTYLGQLQELENRADEQNISIAEFNSKIDQWKADYDKDVAKYKTDVEYKNTQLQQNAEDRAATIGRAMLSAGITPSAAMLSAMGMTPTDYLNYRLSNL